MLLLLLLPPPLLLATACLPLPWSASGHQGRLSARLRGALLQFTCTPLELAPCCLQQCFASAHICVSAMIR